MRHSAPEEILIRRDASRRHGETASRHLRQAQPARARASSFLQVTREQQPDGGTNRMPEGGAPGNRTRVGGENENSQLFDITFLG